MTTIKVYLQDGRVYEYDIHADDPTKAREHAHRIVNYGWRNWEEGRECYYPVHQVLKVTFDMPNKDALAGKFFAVPAGTRKQTTLGEQNGTEAKENERD